jgi:hypothetical protein
MTGVQRIIPIRRDYNRFVADETLEDYALRFTAKKARRWSGFEVAQTALGSVSFLALEAIGGTLALTAGFPDTLAAVLFVGLIIFATAIPITVYAARYGVDMDLLTRGAGFGYLGSTVTSLIYASFTFLFFAIEAAIMALALQLCFGLPLGIGYLLCAGAVIPLVVYGIRLISRFQIWSQPLWIGLSLLPLVFVVAQGGEKLHALVRFPGLDGEAGFDLARFGLATGVLLALLAQVGEQVDFLRFVPEPRGPRDRRWWLPVLAGGAGWILPGMLKILLGAALAVLVLGHGVPPEHAAEPTRMYAVAFGYLTGEGSRAALLLTGLFVLVSQLKINLTNAYAGSIAWSNFFSRLTHSHPGRVVWLVFNVAIALLLMEFGIDKTIASTLPLYASVVSAWVGALAADLAVNKPLGLSPPGIEFKRAHLYAVNPVGTGAMVLAPCSSPSRRCSPSSRRSAPRRRSPGPRRGAGTSPGSPGWTGPRPRSSAGSANCPSKARTWPIARPTTGRSAPSAARSTPAAATCASRTEGWRRRPRPRSPGSCRAAPRPGSARRWGATSR